ncbi:MAG: hypothetical protein OXD50_01125 [Chloroflexi bacterium]|nr:hypothetical protein [Chloroflexota bacterium]
MLFRRLDDHRFHLLIADRARPAATRLIAQPIQPALSEESPPLAGVSGQQPSAASISVLANLAAAARVIRLRSAWSARLVL